MPSATSATVSRFAAALFALTVVAVVWFSLRPLPRPPSGGQIDKLEHFAAYLTLTVLGFAAVRRRSVRLIAGVLALGLLMEVLQALLPTGRTASALDMLANAAGVALAWAGWTWAERRRR